MFHMNQFPSKFLPIVISILIMAFLLCCLSLPTKVAYTLHGAEIDLEGNVLETGTFAIEGRIVNRLLQPDRFQLTHLEFPGCQVGTIYESAYPLYEMTPMPGNYHTFALIELPEYSFATDAQANIFFSEDHSLWIIAVMGRIFVGTADQDPNYAQIMEIWRSHIDSLIEH